MTANRLWRGQAKRRMREQENQNGAIAEWQTAIRQRPNYPEVQSLLGKALEGKRKSGS
jgi:hypothetical protein